MGLRTPERRLHGSNHTGGARRAGAWSAVTIPRVGPRAKRLILVLVSVLFALVLVEAGEMPNFGANLVY